MLSIRGTPEVTKHGIYRKKYHLRALVQSIALLCLVAGFCLFQRLSGSNSTHSTETKTERDAILHGTTSALDDASIVPLQLHRRASVPCEDIEKSDPEWLLVFYIIGVIYMFLALAIVCDEFFVPALEEMSSTRRMNLSMDVAGATLMAAGGSAPELFTSLFGTFTESEIGFGTIVGSAVFNVLFVIAMCSLLAKETLVLTWWPLFRDSAYYAVGLVVLAIFVGVTTKEEILLWEACVLFVMYLGYIVIMYFNRDIYKRITGKELHLDGEEEEEEGEDEVENGEGPAVRALAQHMTGGSQMSLVSGGSLVVERPLAGSFRDHPPSFRWQGTFRAGILKLLRDPDSWIDTAGVGIVAKIAGDADYIFQKVDINGDGTIDQEELGKLFEKLDCHLSSTELDEVFRKLDEDDDGKICEKEFTNWYVRSEELILSRVKHIFDHFDVDHSGTIDRRELKMLLEKLEPRVTDEDVQEAIEGMYQHGSRDEITFEEFSQWYRKSIIYERQKKAVEEDMEGVWENLKPPYGGNWGAWLKYIIVLPLVAVMTFTIPDTQRPGMGRWCYLSFFVSIAWIGGFSYLMVLWADIIGNTIGIPSVIMGYTVLAAGTSVPDLLSSVIVARRGSGDMAVSSSIGSNIFDILVGLPIPWIIYTAYGSKPDRVQIGAENIFISLLVLLAMLLFVIGAVHCQGWKLTKKLGGMMFIFYFAFLVQAILLEIPFETCIKKE